MMSGALLDFDDIFTIKMGENGLKLKDISHQTGISSDKFSKVRGGFRALDPKMALSLANLLGGTRDAWLEVYDLTKNKGPITLETMQALFAPAPPGADIFQLQPVIGSASERLLSNAEIEKLFASPDPLATSMQFMAHFHHAQLLDYGYVVRFAAAGAFDPNDPSMLMIGGGEQRIFHSKETLSLTPRIRLEVCPSWEISCKGVELINHRTPRLGEHGAVEAILRNPSPNPVSFAIKSSFLELRFVHTPSAARPTVSDGLDLSATNSAED